MYNSQYYTCEQIDQRLLQGYLDDYNNQNDTNLTKEQFLTLLYTTLNNGLTIDNIVQGLGSNTDKIMSQKAVTDGIVNAGYNQSIPPLISKRYVNYDGTLITADDWSITSKIPCSEGDIIRWYSGYTSENVFISLVIFDSAGNKLSYVSVGSHTPPVERTITCPENSAYLIASFYNPSIENSYLLVGNIFYQAALMNQPFSILGTIVPAYDSYINITNTEITIPSNSRLIVAGQYIKTNSNVTINRGQGNQSEVVVYNVGNGTFTCVATASYQYMTGDYILFSLGSGSVLCSLPSSYYTFNGNKVNGEIFDVSIYNGTNGTPSVYNSLSDAIAAIPVRMKRGGGGMEIKFIQRFPITYNSEYEVLDSAPSSATRISSTLSARFNTLTAEEITNGYSGADKGSIDAAIAALSSNTSVKFYTEITVDSETKYATWNFKRIGNERLLYVQYLLRLSTWSDNADDWIRINYSSFYCHMSLLSDRKITIYDDRVVIPDLCRIYFLDRNGQERVFRNNNPITVKRYKESSNTHEVVLFDTYAGSIEPFVIRYADLGNNIDSMRYRILFSIGQGQKKCSLPDTYYVFDKIGYTTYNSIIGAIYPFNGTKIIINQNTIIIPSGSRVVYAYNGEKRVYRTSQNITLTGHSVYNQCAVIFKLKTQEFAIASDNSGKFVVDEDYVYLFSITKDGGGSLSPSFVRYNYGIESNEYKSIIDLKDEVFKENTGLRYDSGGYRPDTNAITCVNYFYCGNINGKIKLLGGINQGENTLVSTIAWYDVNRNFIRRETYYTHATEYTIPSNAIWFRIAFGLHDSEEAEVEDGKYLSSYDFTKNTLVLEFDDTAIGNYGVIVPSYTTGVYIDITETNVVIPSGSRMVLGEKYVNVASTVTLERGQGSQSEVVFYNIISNSFGISSTSGYSRTNGDYILFSLSYDANKVCSLPITYFTYKGKSIINNIEDVESIFTYNDKKSVINKLIQLKSIQDGNDLVHDNTKALANDSNMLTLLHFSDLHADVNNLARIVEFWNEFKDTYISDIIHTGDAAYSKIDDSQSVPNVFERVDGAERILNVVGNHDAWLTGTTWYEATSKQTYDYLFKGTGETPMIDNWGVTQPIGAAENGLCYYYKDYASKKIRLIVLDCMHNNTDQETWLDGLLADTLDSNNAAYGYNIIIAVHYQSQLGLTAKNVTFNCLRGDVDAVTTSNYPSSGTVIQDIPDITGTYHVERLPSRMYQKVNAFITNGGKFICWLCGHTHRDYFGTIPGYDNQLQITIDTANGTKGDNYDWESRINHTQSSDCFNIVAFDTLHKLVKIVRIGVNRDSRMRLIDTMCYDYQNGTVISNN
jgi:hypothetical protein